MNSQASTSGPASAIETRALAALTAGSAGYRQFFRSLEGVMQPEDVASARQLFLRGRRGLLAVAGIYALVHLASTLILALALPRFSYAAYGWIYDLERAGLFFAVYYLAAHRLVPVAGRILLPLGFLAFLPWTGGWPKIVWLPSLRLVELIVVLRVAGLCLDAAVSRGTDVAQEKFRRTFLFAAGLLFLGETLLRSHPQQPAWFSLAAVLIVWICETARRRGPADLTVGPNTVFFLVAAWKRWRFHAAGLSLALGLGMFPLLALLNQFDVEAQLRKYHPELLHSSPTQDRHAAEMHLEQWRSLPPELRVVHSGDPACVWSWGIKGLLLTEADFASGRMYLLRLKTMPESQRSNVVSLLRALAVDKWDPVARSNFESALPAWRLTNAAQFLSVVPAGDSPFVAFFANPESEIAREPEPFVPNIGEPIQKLVAEPLSGINRIIEDYQWYKYLFPAFGIAGFVLLWRRGGDSRLARWIGIWLVAGSLIFCLSAINFFLPGIWQAVLQLTHPDRGNAILWAFSGVFDLLTWAVLVLLLLFLGGVPQGVIWGLLCWLPRPPESGELSSESLRYWLRYSRRLAICAVANAGITLSFLLVGAGFSLHSVPDDDIALIKGHLLSLGLALVLGYFFRKRTAARSELPVLGFLPVLAYVAATLTLVCFGLYNNNVPHAPTFKVAGAISGATFCVIAAFLIVRRNFLKVRSIRSFTALILIICLPVILKLVEESLKPMLQQTPLFSEHGAGLAVLLAALLLFPRLHHLLDKCFLYVTDRKLARIEHEAARAVDALNQAATPDAKRTLLVGFLDRLGSQGHALYQDAGHSRPLRLASTAAIHPPESLQVTDGLTRFLSGRHDFVDIQDAPYEWEFFFHQFDLHEIQKQTGCRYVLPVAGEGCLLGLLLFPAGNTHAEDNNPMMAKALGKVAVAAIQRGWIVC